MNIEPGFSREKIAPAEFLDDEENQRRKRRLIYIIAGIAVVLLIAYFFMRAGPEPVAKPEESPSITVMVPGKQEVTRVISVTGSLAARREMPVGVAGEGGMIARVLVDAGDWVKAGQALALVDSSVQVQQANQLRAQIAAARADAALAVSELKRSESLIARGFVSQADVDRKRATRDAANARVNVAQAQLGEIQARIRQLAIHAPSAGLVLTRDVEPGQVVMASSGTLFRIAKDGEMELRANLSEGDVASLSVGDSAQVTPVGSAQHFEGRIWQLSPVVDVKTRQGAARISLGYNKALRPGGFASADIRSGKTLAPLLPESAVLSDGKGNFVYIASPDKKVIRRDVKLGTVGSNGIPVISGLDGSEKVVVSAGAFLSPGDAITPVVQKQK